MESASSRFEDLTPYRFAAVPAIEIGGLEIRPDSREVLGDENRVRVQLTARELEVLLVLVEQADRVVTRESIYAEVWGGRMPYRDRAADVYVRRLREKLRCLEPEAIFIHTHFGIGYRFCPTSTERVENQKAEQSSTILPRADDRLLPHRRTTADPRRRP